MRVVVTTSRRAADEDERAAREAAADLGGAAFVPRRLIPTLAAALAEADAILVISGAEWVLHTAAGPLFYHPGLARQRIASLASGRPDYLVLAADLREGDAVFDATVGLGGDALVASYATGQRGSVRGVEAAPVLALLTAHGLAHYPEPDPALRAAMRRIAVAAGDHLAWLSGMPAGSVDVVLFDPMFEVSVAGAAHMGPLRAVADKTPLYPAAVRAARRVARRRVVIKALRQSRLFADYGCDGVLAGDRSRIAFGYICTRAGER